MMIKVSSVIRVIKEKIDLSVLTRSKWNTMGMAPSLV
jgi:hypothetical protein